MTKFIGTVALAALLALLTTGVTLAFNIVCGEGSQLCRGSDDPDTITGSTGSDLILGEGGDDGIQADPAPSANADDEVRGGSGNDIIIDSLSATDSDVIFGGSGNDTINVRENTGGADTVNCGKGNKDRVFFDVGVDIIAANCEILNPSA
jgi:Ca2+-binding RTX toxin-like protein